MELWEKPVSSSSSSSSSRDHHRLRNRRDYHHHPSFSSTLLDQIYRSIDDSPSDENISSRKKKQHRTGSLQEHHEVYYPEKLVSHRRSIAADFETSRSRSRSIITTTGDSAFLKHSGSSSSDSSAFSSSESDSFYIRSKSSGSGSPPQSTRLPKPIRTTVEKFDDRSSQSHHRSSFIQKSNNGKQELGSFLRTKSKALKIYTDLKKVKQPISPGGRLATFLNSLFTTSAATNNPKSSKKISNVTAVEPQSTTSSTTCSSASSFSRSCLSKTPSSSGKSKRSVRFCPVNVILDEDSTISMTYGHNHRLYEHNEAKFDINAMEENLRVIEAAKDLLRTYQKNKDMATTCNDVNNNVEDDGDDDNDDAASYASSDLFELENLSAIGMEELPVYETTRLDTNRAIATGFVV